MDNLTHSVLGLALGELVERSLPPAADPARGRTRHRLLLFTSWAASNIPDLDLVLTPLAARPLGYLLHHRGHTHTLLYAIPQAIALLALIWLLWPSARQLLRDSPTVRLAAAGLACLGLLLHLGMDYLNVYGIHPFHPFDSRWLYGDMVFIVEPVFWVAFGTPLAIMSTRPFARWLLFALLAGAPLCFALLGYLQWGSLLGLAVLGALLARLGHGWGPRDRRALVAGLAAGAGFVLVQAYALGDARTLVLAQLHQRDPASRVLDVPLSAFAANPLCWSFVTIESNEAAGSYRLRRGVLSLAPAINPVSSCPAALGGAPAEAGIASAAGPAGLVWMWEEAGQLSRLRALRTSNCQFDAWLRFARAPSLQDGLATDLRFGPPDRPNFSTLPLEQAAAQPCPGHVPGWGYPRADLLGLR